MTVDVEVMGPRPSLIAPSRIPELLDGFVRGRVSVIMPAFNEAERISESVEYVKSMFEKICDDFEIIVSDDGSTDGTGRISESILDSRVQVVTNRKNHGKGHALKSGFHYATGQYTFFIDSDMEIHPKEMRAYLDALAFADLAIGSKRHRASQVRTPALRRFLSLGFNIIERMLTGTRATDSQAGLKCARSTALYRIVPLLSVKRYAFDAELLAVASLLNYKIMELPVEVNLRATFSVRQVFRMFIDLLGIAYRLRVKRWYQGNLQEMSDTYKPIISWPD